MSRASSKRLTEAQQVERRERRARRRDERRGVVQALRDWHESRQRVAEKAGAERLRKVPAGGIKSADDPRVASMPLQEWRDYATATLGLSTSAANRAHAQAQADARTEFVVDMRGRGPNRAKRRAAGQRGPRP